MTLLISREPNRQNRHQTFATGLFVEQPDYIKNSHRLFAVSRLAARLTVRRFQISAMASQHLDRILTLMAGDLTKLNNQPWFALLSSPVPVGPTHLPQIPIPAVLTHRDVNAPRCPQF